ncbi:hypothetical protein ILYODFUR_039063 [Ilyodon furcidens]|uniref:Secreted protein n=1 Tax=Ilyodon furcidens TaxID=33524 RepID=A0ABV0UQS5_9TELE
MSSGRLRPGSHRFVLGPAAAALTGRGGVCAIRQARVQVRWSHPVENVIRSTDRSRRAFIKSAISFRPPLRSPSPNPPHPCNRIRDFSMSSASWSCGPHTEAS